MVENCSDHAVYLRMCKNILLLEPWRPVFPRDWYEAVTRYGASILLPIAYASRKVLFSIFVIAQNTRTLSGKRVGLHFVGEGKPVSGVFMMVMLTDMSSWLHKTVIERSQITPRDMRYHAIEDMAAFFVFVKTPVQRFS